MIMKGLECMTGTGYKAKKYVAVCVPGSKSITNRALLLATLADGKSKLEGVLFSDDSRHFLKCVQDLGFDTVVDEEEKVIEVMGCGGKVPLLEASQYVGSAGTAARFLTAYLGVSHGIYHMDASEQMRKRPMAPLIDSLRELGCEITCLEKEGYFPFTIKSNGFSKDRITVDINNSSQFLSALLIASFLSEKDFTVKIQGTHGMSYIDMTCKMMEQFGVRSEYDAVSNSYTTKAGQHYNASEYKVEPDVSAACYFYAAAPLMNVPVLVKGVHSDSLQGDIAFLKVLEQMGCSLLETDEGIIIYPPENGSLKGINVDMSAFSDQAITLAAIAPFADSPTTITGIGHIRFQESDRINAIVTELGKMGIRCDETQDSITIYPGSPKASHVETYDDHRMAMGFSLIGLKAEGIVIENPQCCRKTFENYFEVLDDFINQAAAIDGQN
jgi:3-phosphoshikimate 1-carboxyvinyltransferase